MACDNRIREIGCLYAVFLLAYCHLCSLGEDGANCLVMSLSSVMLAAKLQRRRKSPASTEIISLKKDADDFCKH